MEAKKNAEKAVTPDVGAEAEETIIEKRRRGRKSEASGVRRTFILNPSYEICEAIETLVRACDMSANNLLTELVLYALEHAKLRDKTTKELYFGEE